MLPALSPATLRQRIGALDTERAALTASLARHQQDADAIAFDAEENPRLRAERNAGLDVARRAAERVAEIDAALRTASDRLASALREETRIARTAAIRRAARAGLARRKAAERFDRAMAAAERALTDYAVLEADLTAPLREADLLDSTATGVLAKRARRAVQFAVWANAPELATLLACPRAAVGHRRTLVAADEDALANIQEYGAQLLEGTREAGAAQ